jgi:hypothetical protein
MSKTRAGHQRRQHLAHLRGAEARRNAPRLIMRESKDPADWGPSERPAGKIMKPPIENMLARGVITREQYEAANNIEEIFHAITAGLMTKASKLGEIRAAASGISVPMLDAYVHRYRPWADEISGARQRAPDVSEIARVVRSADEDALIIAAARAEKGVVDRRDQYHPKTLAFVIALVVDGRSIEEIAASERHAKTTVSAAIHRGLTRYAEIAGFLGRRRTAA